MKLPLMPDRTPVKVQLSIAPDLMRDIKEYAELYRETYKQTKAEPVTEILPFIVRHYLDSDKDFAKARKQKDKGARDPSAETSSAPPKQRQILGAAAATSR